MNTNGPVWDMTADQMGCTGTLAEQLACMRSEKPENDC